MCAVSLALGGVPLSPESPVCVVPKMIALGRGYNKPQGLRDAQRAGKDSGEKIRIATNADAKISAWRRQNLTIWTQLTGSWASAATLIRSLQTMG